MWERVGFDEVGDGGRGQIMLRFFGYIKYFVFRCKIV